MNPNCENPDRCGEWWVCKACERPTPSPPFAIDEPVYVGACSGKVTGIRASDDHVRVMFDEGSVWGMEEWFPARLLHRPDKSVVARWRVVSGGVAPGGWAAVGPVRDTEAEARADVERMGQGKMCSSCEVRPAAICQPCSDEAVGHARTMGKIDCVEERVLGQPSPQLIEARAALQEIDHLARQSYHSGQMREDILAIAARGLGAEDRTEQPKTSSTDISSPPISGQRADAEGTGAASRSPQPTSCRPEGSKETGVLPPSDGDRRARHEEMIRLWKNTSVWPPRLTDADHRALVALVDKAVAEAVEPILVAAERGIDRLRNGLRAIDNLIMQKAAEARAYADGYCGDGENENGVSYECLDHYARGLEDAVRLVRRGGA